MAGHNELGKDAEQMAADWLKAKGYEILHRNWRHKYYEIDIIALKNKMPYPDYRFFYMHKPVHVGFL